MVITFGHDLGFCIWRMERHIYNSPHWPQVKALSTQNPFNYYYRNEMVDTPIMRWMLIEWRILIRCRQCILTQIWMVVWCFQAHSEFIEFYVKLWLNECIDKLFTWQTYWRYLFQKCLPNNTIELKKHKKKHTKCL